MIYQVVWNSVICIGNTHRYSYTSTVRRANRSRRGNELGHVELEVLTSSKEIFKNKKILRLPWMNIQGIRTLQYALLHRCVYASVFAPCCYLSGCTNNKGCFEVLMASSLVKKVYCIPIKLHISITRCIYEAWQQCTLYLCK